jgi:Ni,Fe-hydrogenase III component G
MSINVLVNLYLDEVNLYLDEVHQCTSTNLSFEREIRDIQKVFVLIFFS